MSVLRQEGRCSRCSGVMPSGADIDWEMVDGKNRFMHPGGKCPPRGPEAPLRSEPPSGASAGTSYGLDTSRVWLKAEFTAEHGSESMAVHRTLMLSATIERSMHHGLVEASLPHELKVLAHKVREAAEEGVR